MSAQPRFSTLWAVNGPLDPGELHRQLDDFAHAGLDGVVFHPRFYPDRPPYLGAEYLAIVSELVLEAHARGLEFWIYDENGWPSGSVSGEMLRRHPELRQSWLEMQPDRGQRALRRFEHDGRAWALVVREGDGVDYLAPGLAGRFLELCYQRYAEGMHPDAFAKVAGFFSDEPEFGLGHAQHELSEYGAVPWTPDLAERFAERHSQDLTALVPGLFVDREDAAHTRVAFWELVTDLFSDRYLSELDGWCRRRGLRFTAHMKGEEHPLFQLPTVGSLGVVSRAVGTPGIDALGRVPGNDFYPRQASSVARQFGDGRAMAEVFGGAGWGASPADLEQNLLWLGRHGITDFVLHLSQYRLDSAAIEDWPPSHPRHVSWAAMYRHVLQDVRDAPARRGRPPADTLVIVPQRALAALFHPWEFVATNVHDAHDFPPTPAGRLNADFLGLVDALRAAGLDYEFADERTLERDARIEGGQLALGSARYRSVILASGAEVGAAATEVIAAFLRPAPSTPPAASGAPAEAVADVGRPLAWEAPRTPVNELVLEPIDVGDGWWEAVVRSDGFRGSAVARFADDVSAVTWEGRMLELVADGRTAPVEVFPGEGRLRFRLARRLAPGVRPRLWLAGAFRVRGGRARADGPAMSIEGPFALTPPRSALDRELATDGFPFAFEPIEVVARVDVPAGARELVVHGGLADAARLRLADGPAVWRWRDDGWTVPVPADAAGEMRLQLALFPSSFNRYGPHHHYAGDPLVVSPAQMQGTRNYADLDGAPAATHVARWWVRRAVLPDRVVARIPTPPATFVAGIDSVAGELIR